MIDNEKIGSEWWLLLLLSRVSRLDPDTILVGPGDIPSLPSFCAWNVIVLDDILFSGQHLMGVMDTFIYHTKDTASKINFHVVVPFVSSRGQQTINSLKEIYPDRVEDIHFYPVAYIHTIKELFKCHKLDWDKIRTLADAKSASFENKCPLIEYPKK